MRPTKSGSLSGPPDFVEAGGRGGGRIVTIRPVSPLACRSVLLETVFEQFVGKTGIDRRVDGAARVRSPAIAVGHENNVVDAALASEADGKDG